MISKSICRFLKLPGFPDLLEILIQKLRDFEEFLPKRSVLVCVLARVSHAHRLSCTTIVGPSPELLIWIQELNYSIPVKHIPLSWSMTRKSGSSEYLRGPKYCTTNHEGTVALANASTISNFPSPWSWSLRPTKWERIIS